MTRDVVTILGAIAGLLYYIMTHAQWNNHLPNISVLQTF